LPTYSTAAGSDYTLALEACAQALHAAGARVCVSARQADLLHEFTAQHPGSVAMALDVTDANALTQAADSLQAQHGLDVIIY
jgi:NADP-dependent 3-hydroxy acid dehydrogenase YdfG